MYRRARREPVDRLAVFATIVPRAAAVIIGPRVTRAKPMTDPQSLHPPRITRTQIAGLIFILLAALFFRLNQLTTPSLWMDEIWSIEMAMGHGSVHDHLPPGILRHDAPDLTSLDQAAPWPSILTHLGGVTHPPLFFLALRWWIDCFGSSAASVRTLSVLFSLAILPVLFDICRFLHSPRIALFATAITALSLVQIELAQDARSYTMLLFFSLAAADAVIRIQFLGPTRNRFIALTLCALATALTHYLSAGFLIALAAYAMIRIPTSARRQTLGAFALAAALSLAVWAPLFLSQKNTLPSLTPTFLMEARDVNHPKLTLYRIIGLPTEFLLGEDAPDPPGRMSTKIVIALFIFTCILPLLRLPWRKISSSGSCSCSEPSASSPPWTFFTPPRWSATLATPSSPARQSAP